MTYFEGNPLTFCSLSLSAQKQIVTPKPTTLPSTVLNLTHGPTPSITAPPTRQPSIIVSTKVPVDTPPPGVLMAPPTSAPDLPAHTNNTNHTSAPSPGPPAITGGDTEENITPTLRPTTLPVPSKTEDPSNTTLTTDPDGDAPDHDDSDNHPSMTTKPPEINTTPYISIPPGVCMCVR